jgi:hypothetical protein
MYDTTALALALLLASSGTSVADVLPKSPYQFTAYTKFGEHRRDIRLPSKFTIGGWQCEAFAPWENEKGWLVTVACSSDKSPGAFGIAVSCSESTPVDTEEVMVGTGNGVVGRMFLSCAIEAK